jgi:hypothetical protein
MELILIIIAVIGMLAIGFALFSRGRDPEFYQGLYQLLDCCSSLGVFGITIVLTIGGFLLWHSLFVAALVGGSIMTIMLIVLSVVAATYKAGSRSSSPDAPGRAVA